MWDRRSVDSEKLKSIFKAEQTHSVGAPEQRMYADCRNTVAAPVFCITSPNTHLSDISLINVSASSCIQMHVCRWHFYDVFNLALASLGRFAQIVSAVIYVRQWQLTQRKNRYFMDPHKLRALSLSLASFARSRFRLQCLDFHVTYSPFRRVQSRLCAVERSASLSFIVLFNGTF